ncbi:hypothetical protein H0H92_015349 [Tricholoma furcatifolium]|nr:hypothetical protein H0H92_015349 [Tricholoma furcatifolium]
MARLAIDDGRYYPHPHPPDGYADSDASTSECDHPTQGLRLRTVMVLNVPSSLRKEKELKEYFEFYMPQQLQKPSLRITSSIQPGILSKSLATLFRWVKALFGLIPSPPHEDEKATPSPGTAQITPPTRDVPLIERVVITRKMTSLASLIERRQAMLHLLESAHVELAKNTLLAVKEAMDRRHANLLFAPKQTRAIEIANKQPYAVPPDPERGDAQEAQDAQMDHLIEVLEPFVEEFGLTSSLAQRCRMFLADGLWKLFQRSSSIKEVQSSSTSDRHRNYSQLHPKTVWEVMSELPRSSLDSYQPLVNLSFLFRGKTVPAVDYYTSKLNILTSLVAESRSKPLEDYEPVSTAFVTFADPEDARKACKCLAVHPDNPLECKVSMAPMFQDLNWKSLMKSSFNAEKSVNVGLAASLILFTAVTKLMMTRMCRAQFEQDDIDETKAVCGRNDILNDTSSSVRREAAGSNNDPTSPGPRGWRHKIMKTWRLPRWMNFSYATPRRRPDHLEHRETIPSNQPSAQPQSTSSSQDPEEISEVHRNSSLGELHRGNAPAQEDETHPSLTTDISFVSKHPLPVPWDDEGTLDLPYDNPYYSRTLENVLWLPRDPFGILDLDDTIDLRISLCVDVAVGQLGSWLGFGETTSPIEISGVPNCPVSVQKSSPASLLAVDGTENIELPLAIAQRVNAREDNREWTIRPKRPANRGRRFSATMPKSEITTLRRPSFPIKDPILQENIIACDQGGHSSLSAQHLASNPCQTPILEQKPVLQTHAQVLSAATSNSISRLSRSSHAHLRNLTAREAIFNEVLAEEKAAMVDQIKIEEQDTGKVVSKKSWLTAWMFRKRN